MRRVCAPPRTDSLVPTNMTSTAILRVCSGSLAATRKGRSRACHFGTTFKSWCRIFFACGGHQMIFLSRLGPGSSPGRAESQLSQVSSGSFLIFSVLNAGSGAAAAVPHSRSHRHRHRQRSGRAQQVQPAGAASTSAALSPPRRQQPRIEVTMPPPPCRRRRCRLCLVCAVATVVAVKLLSVGVSSSVSGVHTHAEKLRQMSGRGGRSWPA